MIVEKSVSVLGRATPSPTVMPVIQQAHTDHHTLRPVQRQTSLIARLCTTGGKQNILRPGEHPNTTHKSEGRIPASSPGAVNHHATLAMLQLRMYQSVQDKRPLDKRSFGMTSKNHVLQLQRNSNLLFNDGTLPTRLVAD